jgi:hypothetical protein
VVLAKADVRDLRTAVSGSFDAAVSCDNSLPHLLTRYDLERAAGSIRARATDVAASLSVALTDASRGLYRLDVADEQLPQQGVGAALTAKAELRRSPRPPYRHPR